MNERIQNKIFEILSLSPPSSFLNPQIHADPKMDSTLTLTKVSKKLTYNYLAGFRCF